MTLDEYVAGLRKFIKDYEDLNRLLNFSLENDDESLKLYLNMAQGYLNAIPPMLQDPRSLSINDIALFPMPSLLLHQATIECLVSNSIVASRNDLTYNNGGVTVKIDDGNRYMNMLQALYKITDNELSMYVKLKIAMNIEGGYGGIASPFAYMPNYGRGYNRLV